MNAARAQYLLANAEKHHTGFFIAFRYAHQLDHVVVAESGIECRHYTPMREDGITQQEQNYINMMSGIYGLSIYDTIEKIAKGEI